MDKFREVISVTKVRRILSIFFVGCMILSLCACGGDGLEKKVLGEWVPVGDDGSITFLSDGTGKVDDDEIEWKVSEDDTLELTFEGHTITVKVVSISSERMTWEMDGESMELKKRDW